MGMNGHTEPRRNDTPDQGVTSRLKSKNPLCGYLLVLGRAERIRVVSWVVKDARRVEEQGVTGCRRALSMA